MSDDTERKRQQARANRQLTDLPNVDEERAARLDRAGLGSMDALAKATPKEIADASGLGGMDAIIAKEQAERTVEARKERSVSGKLSSLVAQASPQVQRKARMWLTARVGRFLNGGR